MRSVSFQNKNDIIDLSDDETEVIHLYRRAKKIRNSEMTIAVQDGKRIKLWLTEKRR